MACGASEYAQPRPQVLRLSASRRDTSLAFAISQPWRLVPEPLRPSFLAKYLAIAAKQLALTLISAQSLEDFLPSAEEAVQKVPAMDETLFGVLEQVPLRPGLSSATVYARRLRLAACFLDCQAATASTLSCWHLQALPGLALRFERLAAPESRAWQRTVVMVVELQR